MIYIDATSIHWPGANRYLRTVLMSVSDLKKTRDIDVRVLVHSSNIVDVKECGMSLDCCSPIHSFLIPRPLAKVLKFYMLSKSLSPGDFMLINSAALLAPTDACIIKVWHSTLHLHPVSKIYLRKMPFRYLRLVFELLLDRLLAQHVTINIFPTIYARQLAQAKLDLPDKASLVFPHDVSYLLSLLNNAKTSHAIKRRASKSADKHIRLVYIASVDWYKNHCLFLDLLEKSDVHKLYQNIEIILIGPIVSVQLSKKLIAQADRLNITLKITGRLSRDKTMRILETALASISFSACESFSYPLLEAIASGIPVIAHDTDLHREVLGNAGLYVSAPCHLNQLFARLYQSTEAYESLCQLCLSRAAQLMTREPSHLKVLDLVA